MARHALILSLILIGLVGAVFFPSFRADFVQYDDPAFVTRNGYVNEGLTGVGVNWAFTQRELGKPLMHEGVGNVWHPLTWISHMIDVELWGLENPGGHHAMSVLLHALSTVLVFFCGLRLCALRKLAANHVLAVAFFLAAVFAIHPLHVESVAWVSERKDVLSGFFFFGSLLAYLHDRRWLSVLLFLPALMAKPSVVVLPLLLMLIDWWRTGFIIQKNPLPVLVRSGLGKIIWWMPAIIATALGIWVQYTGTHSDFVGGSLTTRLVTMATGVWFYFWRMVVPVDLSFQYPFPPYGMVLFPLGWLALISVVALLWRKRKEWPEAFFGIAWFLILWLPSSGLVYVGNSFTADRYTYLAMLGPVFTLAVGLVKFGKPALISGGVITLILGTLAHQQVKVWNDSEALFSHAIKAQPREAIGLQNYASLLQMEGRNAEAIPLYEKAIKISPNDYIGKYNLANCYRKMGRLDEAEAKYEESLSVYPGYVPAWINLGELLANPEYSGHDPQAAREALRKACQLSQLRNPLAAAALLKFEARAGNQAAAKNLYNQLPDFVKQHPAISSLIKITPTPR